MIFQGSQSLRTINWSPQFIWKKVSDLKNKKSLVSFTFIASYVSDVWSVNMMYGMEYLSISWSTTLFHEIRTKFIASHAHLPISHRQSPPLIILDRLVMFYSPYNKETKQFVKRYTKLAATLKKNGIKTGAVNCEREQFLCTKNKAQHLASRGQSCTRYYGGRWWIRVSDCVCAWLSDCVCMSKWVSLYVWVREWVCMSDKMNACVCASDCVWLS